ncbi:MAG TPA: sigma-70 family RNA polymerase sigma factor, partial [Micromonosporaceae bacterium]|nr:sigma-70 family RNA polymerase sigma factor [Micromonosporaceae bacterium]
QRESVDAYVRRILVNTYLSHRRDRRREVVTEPPDGPASVSDADSRLDIGRALAALPAGQRAMVVLRYLEDLPVREVAMIMGTAEGTVKSQTARGVEAMRRALGVSTLTGET